MWGIALRGVIAHRLRYALTALAVLLGVAFIAGTFVLTDTINGTFDSLYNQIYSSTAAVVRAAQPFSPGVSYTAQRRQIDDSLASVVASVPGVRAVGSDITGYAQLIGKNGKPIGVASNGPPTLGESWIDVPALNQLRLLPGSQPPRGPGQVVIDKHSADVGHFRVGDTVRILTRQSPAVYTITGIATWGGVDSPLGASLAAFDQATAARVLGQPGKVDQLDVQAAPGVSQDALVTRIKQAIHTPGVEVVTGQSITAEGQQSVHQAMSIVGTVMLVFGYIALFVGAFVIFNTFSIIVAQRLRELALLRAVGASRRQVLGEVLGESAVIGLAASAVGVAAGVGLAAALKAAMSAFGLDLPATGLVVSSRTVIVGLAAGTLITVASAIAPARRAATIAPVAALRDVAAEPRRASVKRAAWRVALTVAGVAVLATGLFSQVSNRIAFVGAGAVAVFIGVAALGPFITRPVCRVLGVPLASAGTPGKLAQENAVRSPARTSSTAAALMVGVALVSMITIMASSVRASVGAVLDSSMRADFVVSSGAANGSGSGLSPSIEQSLAALPQVSDVAGIREGIVKAYGAVVPVVAADPVKAAPLFNMGVTQGSMAAMTPTGIAVSTQLASDKHLSLHSPVAVTYPTTGTKTYTVQAIYSQRALVGGDYVLPLAAAEANLRQALDISVYVKLAPGVTTAAARPALDRVLAAYPTATLQDQAQYKAQQQRQVSGQLNLMYGLLALAVSIALIGIANTLALSIYERTRELGLLRAVGATRRQLRLMVRYEALVIAMFGAVEGLVLGIVFGWAVVASEHSQGVTRLVFPIGQLLLVVVLASLAGVVAAISPSRRAARLNVLQAVTTE